jgi:nicotinamidase/pyrazinamidase
MKPLLDIVDFSKGFVLPERTLYVPNAEQTIEPAHEFLKKAEFSYALLKNDTHFEGEYIHSDEAQSFDFHQGFGTSDHEYLIDPEQINAEKVFWLLKNKFDMWAENADVNVPFDQIKFSNAEEKRVYQGLYKLAIVENGRYVFAEHRDIFMQRMLNTGHTDVVMFGHASDYCVRDAILGYLSRGFTVYLIVDLCRGIWNPNLLGGVSKLEELIERCPQANYATDKVVDRTIFKDAALQGQLILTTSKEYLEKQNR